MSEMLGHKTKAELVVIIMKQEKRIQELEKENNKLREQPGMIIYRSVRPLLDVPEGEKVPKEGKDERSHCGTNRICTDC